MENHHFVLTFLLSLLLEIMDRKLEINNTNPIVNMGKFSVYLFLNWLNIYLITSDDIMCKLIGGIVLILPFISRIIKFINTRKNINN